MATINKNNYVLNKATNNFKPKDKKSNWLRNPEDEAFYNSKKWRGLSLRFKKFHPVCKTLNCTQASYFTDHIIPISEGGEKWDWDNFQALCKSCNAIKTAKQKQSLVKNKY
jgi:5-methylcytosine-specific restriction endonuclease McrA